MRSIVLIALLVPTVALADIITLRVNDAPSVSFSANDCANNLRVTWTVTQIQSPQPCSDLKIWVTESSSCPTAPAGNDKELASVSPAVLITNPTGSANIRLGELPGQNGADAGFTCGAELQKVWKVCAYEQTPAFTGITSSCSSPGSATANANVTYDGLPPDAPTISSVSPLSQGLRVTTALPQDAQSIRIGHRESGSTGDYTFTTDLASVGTDLTTDITGLTNEVTYQVVAVAVDAAGNVSAQSEPVEGTPTQTYGFWANYRNQGGPETGGCSVAVNGESKLPAWALLALLAAGITLVSRRMRS